MLVNNYTLKVNECLLYSVAQLHTFVIAMERFAYVQNRSHNIGCVDRYRLSKTIKISHGLTFRAMEMIQCSCEYVALLDFDGSHFILGLGLVMTETLMVAMAARPTLQPWRSLTPPTSNRYGH